MADSHQRQPDIHVWQWHVMYVPFVCALVGVPRYLAHVFATQLWTTQRVFACLRVCVLFVCSCVPAAMEQGVGRRRVRGALFRAQPRAGCRQASRGVWGAFTARSVVPSFARLVASSRMFVCETLGAIQQRWSNSSTSTHELLLLYGDAHMNGRRELDCWGSHFIILVHRCVRMCVRVRVRASVRARVYVLRSAIN